MRSLLNIENTLPKVMSRRHIDSAVFYGNEREVGEAIRLSGIEREDVFVSEYG